jgi:hypothetical protein
VYLLNRLNILHSFFGKERTWKVCFAQKTPKNKCLNLLENGKYKVDFGEKIRDISSPKYSIKQYPQTFG